MLDLHHLVQQLSVGRLSQEFGVRFDLSGWRRNNIGEFRRGIDHDAIVYRFDESKAIA